MNGLRQIFFCGCRILQLICHKVEAANAMLKITKNIWDGNFSDFIDLQEKKQVWQILFNFINVAGFKDFNYTYSWQRSSSSH